jgi:hypothetical protein
MKKYLALFLAALFVASAFTGCGDKASPQLEESSQPSILSPSEPPSDAPQSAQEPPAATDTVTTVDQYYANENFMVEMLINDSCVVEENGSNLMISTSEGHAAVILSLIPGIQNLSAAAEMASQTVQNAISGAALGEATDGNLFGARAKLVSYEVADEGGNVTLMGLEAAAIVNQSCYLLNMMMDSETTGAEADLIVNVFDSMNILRPAGVDQDTKQATYTSHYQDLLDATTVTPSIRSDSQPVDSWSSLPYDYYSWLGDAGDYGDYPDWYYEPDWDYYADEEYYWDWGWDDSDNWTFYDEYSDYYSYDYYQEYDDYWDGYDPWSDPGDYSEGYGDYFEEEYYGYPEEEMYGYPEEEAYGYPEEEYYGYPEEEAYGYPEEDYGYYEEDYGYYEEDYGYYE